MKSERRKFGKALIFTVLIALLAFVSVGCASARDTIIVRDGTYKEKESVNNDLRR